MAETAYYTIDGDRFIATEYTRGPWSDRHQHAGPPSALLARAAEAIARDAIHEPAGQAMQLVRLTVEIFEPIPIGAFTITTEVERGGRKVRLIQASLIADGSDGRGERAVCRARALLVRRKALELPPRSEPGRGVAGPPPGPDTGEHFEFPFFDYSTPGYHQGVEMRMVRGVHGEGPTTTWFRVRHPLIAGEPLSPWQRVVVAADSGNGVSLLGDPKQWIFVNPDLGVTLHREPEGEWIALDAATLLGTTGVGLAESALFDVHGRVGRSTQTLFVDRRS